MTEESYKKACEIMRDIQYAESIIEEGKKGTLKLSAYGYQDGLPIPQSLGDDLQVLIVSQMEETIDKLKNELALL